MTETVYQDLAKHLDKLSGGFPPSESGAEIRILQRLFTPEEAGLAVTLRCWQSRPRLSPAGLDCRLRRWGSDCRR